MPWRAMTTIKPAKNQIAASAIESYRIELKRRKIDGDELTLVPWCDTGPLWRLMRGVNNCKRGKITLEICHNSAPEKPVGYA